MVGYFCDMTDNDMATLEPADVAHVLMRHSRREPWPAYEQHVMRWLLPRLHRAGFASVRSVWGVAPCDPEQATEYLDQQGYLHSFHCATVRLLDAGEGLTAVCVVMYRNRTIRR